MLSPWEFDEDNHDTDETDETDEEEPPHSQEKEAPADLLFNENDESKRRFDKPAKKRKVNEKSKPELPSYLIISTFVIPCPTTSLSKR